MTRRSRKNKSAHKRNIFLALLIVFGLWHASFSITAHHADTFMRDFIEIQKRESKTFTYASHKKEEDAWRLPWRVRHEFNNINWITQNGISLKAQSLVLYAVPWNPRGFSLEWDEETTLTIPTPSKLIVSFQGKGMGSLSITAPSTISDLTLIGQNTTATLNNDPLFKAETLTIQQTRKLPIPQTHLDTGLSVQLEINKAELVAHQPAPFGSQIEKATLHYRIMGNPPDFTNSQSLKEWSDNSGTIEIDTFDLDWKNFQAHLNGTLAFDATQSPQGAFTLDVKNFDHALEKLQTTAMITKEQSKLLKNIFKPKHPTTPDLRTAPVSYQNKSLYLGQMELFKIRS